MIQYEEIIQDNNTDFSINSIFWGISFHHKTKEVCSVYLDFVFQEATRLDSIISVSGYLVCEEENSKLDFQVIKNSIVELNPVCKKFIEINEKTDKILFKDIEVRILISVFKYWSEELHLTIDYKIDRGITFNGDNCQRDLQMLLNDNDIHVFLGGI